MVLCSQSTKIRKTRLIKRSINVGRIFILQKWPGKVHEGHLSYWLLASNSPFSVVFFVTNRAPPGWCYSRPIIVVTNAFAIGVTMRYHIAALLDVEQNNCV